MRVLFFLLTFSVPSCAPLHSFSITNQKTNILVQENPDTITFFITGNPVAQINAEGLQIKGNVEYEGTIRDTGASSSKNENIDKGSDNEK